MGRKISGVLLLLTLIMTACGSNSLDSTLNNSDKKSELETISNINKSESTEEITAKTTVDPDGFENKQEEVRGDDTMIPIVIQIGDKSFTVNLYKNSTTDKFVEQLPLTLDMSELNGNEKYNYISTKLPTNTESIGSIQTGDLMLYGSDCIVLFYQDFETSYSYTKMGYLDDATGLASALGQGNIRISFMIHE